MSYTRIQKDYHVGIRVIIFASGSVIVRFDTDERVSNEGLQAGNRLLEDALIQTLPRGILTRGEVCYNFAKHCFDFGFRHDFRHLSFII